MTPNAPQYWPFEVVYGGGPPYGSASADAAGQGQVFLSPTQVAMHAQKDNMALQVLVYATAGLLAGLLARSAMRKPEMFGSDPRLNLAVYDGRSGRASIQTVEGLWVTFRLAQPGQEAALLQVMQHCFGLRLEQRPLPQFTPAQIVMYTCLAVVVGVVLVIVLGVMLR
jgi:hypothetical protein